VGVEGWRLLKALALSNIFDLIFELLLTALFCLRLPNRVWSDHRQSIHAAPLRAFRPF